MMRRLRWRFIAAAMGAVLVVVAVNIGAINLTLYLQNENRLDAVLDLLAENDGRFPDILPATDVRNLPISAETRYETRYFSALFNKDGDLIRIDVSNIAGARAEYAATFAEYAYAENKERGSIEHYRYLSKKLPEGKALYFLDRQQLDSMRHAFMMNSLSVATIGYIAASILVILFSERAIRPFMENYKRQRRFITDAGHELKTPLAIISADVDIIELTDGESEWTTSIHRQVDRMTRLVSELLKLATMEEGGLVRHHTNLDFSALVQETVDSFRPMAHRENRTIHADIVSPLNIRGDSQSLNNLVSVLIDNAIKYSSDDAEINVTLYPRGRGAILTVANPCDNPPDTTELNRLFERFYRADESRDRKSGGFGIGLSMAKAIVHAHKGRISAKSENGMVYFTVVL